VIVCSCRAVSDRTIDAAIASGAQTIEDISSRCSAGGRCGGCWPTLQRLLDDHDAKPASSEQSTAA
jgi:bacterioferritin-associated ferredoxin